MSEITAADVQAVVFAFLQRCFVGNVPKAIASTDDAEWVRAAMREADNLVPSDIAEWPLPKQRAIYDLLSDALILSGLQPGKTFPPGELSESHAGRLAQPLLSGLATIPVDALR